jgi:TrfA protein
MVLRSLGRMTRSSEVQPERRRDPGALASRSAAPLVDRARFDQLRIDAYLRSKGIDPRQPRQLQLWPDTVRALPNDCARSALFTVRNKTEPRASLQGATIFHIDARVRITYTGIELRADDDELVWQQILDYAKRRPLGEAIFFNLHRLCRDIAWSINARNYERARRCIARLKANALTLENASLGKGVALSLIHAFEFERGRDGSGTRYRVWIHPDLLVLFAGDTYTQLAWEHYRALSPIARRLHDYGASHKMPFPLGLDAFRAMCASTCRSARKWRQQVKAACAELVAARLLAGAAVVDQSIHLDR